MTRRRQALLFALGLTSALLPGCSGMRYSSIGKASVTGTLEVRWVKPDRFIYIPSADDPLTIVTSEQRTIRPQRMYTDGGSIPRLFWGIPGLSPWGYAPAYVVHDWLFEAHHCQLGDYKDVTFDDSARYLAEAIKALMESGAAPKDESTLVAIFDGVKTPIAKSVWDRPNACSQLEPTERRPADEGVLLQVIKLPKK